MDIFQPRNDYVPHCKCVHNTHSSIAVLGMQVIVLVHMYV